MARSQRRSLLLATAALAGVAARAHAWPYAGDIVSAHTATNPAVSVLPDTVGGAVTVMWTDSGDREFTHYDPDGAQSTGNATVPFGFGFVSDGDGGVYYYEFTAAHNADGLRQVEVHHLDAAGAPRSVGPPPGAPYVVAFTPGIDFVGITATSDGARGLYLAGFATASGPVSFQHLLAGGIPVVGPDSLGTVVYQAQITGEIPVGLGVSSDGAGGLFVMLANDPATVVRIHEDGSPFAGWPGHGLRLASASQAGGFLATPFASGPSNFLASWAAGGHAYLQRFGGGKTDSAWPPNGIDLGPLSQSPSALPDSEGGAFVSFVSGGQRLAARVRPDATFDPAWPAAGRPLLLPGDVDAGGLAVAPTSGGGLLEIWADGRNAPRREVRARWLLSDGTPDPDEPASGRLVSPDDSLALPLTVVPDGRDGAFVAWRVDDLKPYFTELRVGHVGRAGTTAVASVPVGHAALAAPWPNPARGAFTLAFVARSPGGARVELVDVAGRRVRALDVAGAGPHRTRVDGLAGLAPGLYFVRVTDGPDVRTARVALVR